MKKNINLFYGENTIFLNKELDKWIRHFETKYGNFNISKIHRENLDKSNLISEIQTPPFLSEFRLIVIEDLFTSNDKQDTGDNHLNKILPGLISALENVPDNNILLFVSLSKIEKNNLLLKKIAEIGTIKEFPNLDESGIKIYIRENLLGIDSAAIDKLIKFKGGNLQKIEHEIEKLQLFRTGDRISVEDIEKYIAPEMEISIFDFIDEIYNLNYKNVISKFRTILEQNKVEPIFASILSNFRKYLYIVYLNNKGCLASEITEGLKAHPYFTQKSISNKQKYNAIKAIYSHLVDMDLKLKTGELIGESEINFKLAFEKMILDLKNNKILIK